MAQQQLADTEQSTKERITAQQVRHKQELVREQEKVKRTEKLLKEEHERGNSLLTRVKDLELQNTSLRYLDCTEYMEWSIYIIKVIRSNVNGKEKFSQI